MADTEYQMEDQIASNNPTDEAGQSGGYEEPATGSTETGTYAEQPAQASAPGNEETVELQPLMNNNGGYGDGNVMNLLSGKYYEFEMDGKIINLQLKSVGDYHKETDTAGVGLYAAQKERSKTKEEIEKEEKIDEIFTLVPDSTNAWLYIKDAYTGDDEEDDNCDCLKKCSDNMVNKFIALFVLMLQIAAYITMTVFLGTKRNKEFEARKETCYGPNCGAPHSNCMDLTTGGLTSVLLVGFLWADVVNTISIMRRSCRWGVASIAVLCELLTAIVCGFLVGIYSETDFDAIGGAVGILFVHDLDEKVFASMQSFRGTACATLKKIVAITLWIVLSMIIAIALSCTYNNGSFIGTCKDTEFECGNQECIWEGFVCNGVEDCSDGSDEGEEMCEYSTWHALYGDDFCPDGKFFCVEDGSCISNTSRCNGILDCPSGSDEGRSQNCSEVIRAIKCGATNFNISERYPGINDSYHKVWEGKFKCNNGQCIDAAYACDGTEGDCVDGSDEYPYFGKYNEWPFLRECPYAELVECSSEQILCKINGQCIGKTSLCDGVKDCPDGADEINCDYDCQSDVEKLTTFQCSGQIAKINTSHIVLFSNISQAISWDKGKTNIDEYFQNSTGECIPNAWQCDGVYDCADGSDEIGCSLFSCSSTEYQCSDSGACIPKSWLCDGENDCPNAEDEDRATCIKNGVSVSSNACIQQGYAYQCDNFADICVSYYGMCDGWPDCPYGDDEIEANCDAASSTPSPVSSSSAELTCSETVTGSTSYGYHSFTFTMPASGTTNVRFTTCLTANQGESFIYLSDPNDISYWAQSTYDYSCPCSSRAMFLGATSGADGMTTFALTAGTTYQVDFYPYFSGTYAIKVDCGTAAYSGGGACTETSSSGGGGSLSSTSTLAPITDSTSIACGATETGSVETDGFKVYSYTPTSDVTFDGCASAGDTVFTIIQVDTGITWATNDDSFECSSSGSYVISYYDYTYSGQYYLVITGYAGGSASYSVTMTCGSAIGGGSTPSPLFGGGGSTPSPLFGGGGSTPSPLFGGGSTPSPLFGGTPSPLFGGTPSPLFRRRQ